MTATRSPHSLPDKQKVSRVIAESTPTESDSLADITERLFGAFEAQFGLAAIADIVRRCRGELDVVSGPALPELLERLAHQRLTDLAARAV